MIKKTRLSLNRVRDRVEIKEGNETLELVVDADCMRIVPLITDAREKMIQAAQYKGEGKEEKDFFGNLLTPYHIITRKPIVPSDEETESNSRARSAKLRIAEKK